MLMSRKSPYLIGWPFKREWRRYSKALHVSRSNLDRATFISVSEMSVEATVLDILRPIFPKLDDHVLSLCIRKVQEEVRSDRRTCTHTITQKCANSLLDNVVSSKSKVIGNPSNVRKNTPFNLNTVTPSPCSQSAGKTVGAPRRLPFKTPTVTRTLRNWFPRKSTSTTRLGSITSGCSGNEPTKTGLEREAEIEPTTQSATPNVLVSEPRELFSGSPGEAQKEKDYMKDFCRIISGEYSEECFQKLENEFWTIPVKYIKMAFSKHKGHYESSRIYLQEQLRISMVSSATATSTTTTAPHTTSGLPSTVEATNSTNYLGFDKPPKIQLLKRKRRNPPANKADIPCQKQPGSKKRKPDQDAKEMAPPETSKEEQLPKDNMQSNTPVKVAQTGKVLIEGIPSDDDLEELANCIAEQWMKLGRRLQISQHKLDRIDHRWPELYEKAYRMLLCWKQQNTSKATYSILSAALCHRFVNHQDLAEKICFH